MTAALTAHRDRLGTPAHALRSLAQRTSISSASDIRRAQTRPPDRTTVVSRARAQWCSARARVTRAGGRLRRYRGLSGVRRQNISANRQAHEEPSDLRRGWRPTRVTACCRPTTSSDGVKHQRVDREDRREHRRREAKPLRVPRTQRVARLPMSNITKNAAATIWNATGRFPRDAAVAAPAPRLSVNSPTWHEVPRWGQRRIRCATSGSERRGYPRSNSRRSPSSVGAGDASRTPARSASRPGCGKFAIVFASSSARSSACPCGTTSCARPI